MKKILFILCICFALTAKSQGGLKVDGAAMVGFYMPKAVIDRMPAPYEDLSLQQHQGQEVDATGGTSRSTPGFSISIEPYLNDFIKIGLGYSTQAFTNSYNYDVKWTDQNNQERVQIFKKLENYGLSQFMLRGLGTTTLADALVLQGGFQLNYNVWKYNSDYDKAVSESRKLDPSFGAGMVISAGYHVSEGGQLMYEFTVGDIMAHKIGLRFRIR